MDVSSRLCDLATKGRMAIYTDIDGTISPIAPTPAEAYLFPGAAEALSEISRHGIRVVAISGRAADDAHRLVGIDHIDYAGNHGFELKKASGRVVSEDVTAGALAIKAALAELSAAAGSLPTGILIEDKTYTGSVHYRLTEDPDASAILLKAMLSEIAERHSLLLTDGRLVLELRPRLDINKGVFASNDIRLHGIRTAAFLGDDITDLDGFRAIHEMISDDELVDGVAVGVRAPDSPERLEQESDLLVDGVAGMVLELQRFAESLTMDESQ
jgi:trehalose 6-phosphate phosphatase